LESGKESQYEHPKEDSDASVEEIGPLKLHYSSNEKRFSGRSELIGSNSKKRKNGHENSFNHSKSGESEL
jgi:hypothetical protein